MEFDVAAAEALHATDAELTTLLTRVYVDAGYTQADEAVGLFEPAALRKRGELIAARAKQGSELSGMIILVPPGSPARRLAKDNEVEIQLLAVKPEYRRHGLGRMLVEKALMQATDKEYSKIILWTQVSMHAAQRLYESVGFIHFSDITRNGREFKVYKKNIADY